MKHTLTILGFFIGLTAFGQSYQLVPDSCSFCFYKTLVGSNPTNYNNYGIHPSTDTTLLGNSYMLLSGIDTVVQPFAIRQSGNQLYGVVQDSASEVLIMDFDAMPGDTVFNLYSEGYRYNARVTQKDSSLLNNGSYHHYMRLHGYEIFVNGNWTNGSWETKWNEKGLCKPDITGFDWDYGGVLYNIPYHNYVSFVPYVAPRYCTTDTSYTSSAGYTCVSCQPINIEAGITEINADENKKLLRIVNILGQETKDEPGKVLFFIYSDGTTKKVFRVE